VVGDDPVSDCEFKTKVGIVVHHTAGPKDQSVQAIREYHVRERGWQDIGYHFVITKVDGKWSVCRGRPTTKHGSHCIGHNDCIGVAVCGNYESDEFEPEAESVLVSLLVRLCVGYDLNTSRISPHKDLAITLCPGKNLMSRWTYILQLVGEGLSRR
jgi:hypothetical protein